MIGAWETTTNGALALGLALSAQLALGGCAHSVTEQTVKSPLLERRTQVDASEPLVQSEWQVVGGRVVGHVTWGSCVSQRRWSIEKRRVERVRPLPTPAWLAVGAGAASMTVGYALRKTDPVVECHEGFTADAYFRDCRAELPDNTTSDILLVAGVTAVVGGLLALGIHPSDKVTVLEHEPYAETKVAPCFAVEDLSDMSLVLKLGADRFVHVTVQPDGEASADLSPGARLPRGADLPILVYRAPPALVKTLPRWQVVGTVHVPE
jgi:hypothetical protein